MALSYSQGDYNNGGLNNIFLGENVGKRKWVVYLVYSGNSSDKNGTLLTVRLDKEGYSESEENNVSKTNN